MKTFKLVLTLSLFALSIAVLPSCGSGDDDARAKEIADSLRADSIMMVEALADSLYKDSLQQAMEDALNSATQNIEGSKGSKGSTNAPTETPETPKTETPPADDGKKPLRGKETTETPVEKKPLRGKTTEDAPPPVKKPLRGK